VCVCVCVCVCVSVTAGMASNTVANTVSIEQTKH